jgi:acyl-coenzyme A thioesterase PaaI-like protein
VCAAIYGVVFRTLEYPAPFADEETTMPDAQGSRSAAVGVTNVTAFLRPHRSGRLDVVAVAVQQGRTQQLWQVEIRRPEDGKLVARGQVRLQNVGAS